MNLSKFIKLVWWKVSFFKVLMAVWLVFSVGLSFYIYLKEYNLFKGQGVSFSFPVVFNTYGAIGYYFIHIFSILVIFHASYFFHQKPYRYFLTYGYSRRAIFLLHQKLILLYSFLNATGFFIIAFVIGLLEQDFQQIISLKSIFWYFILIVQSVVLLNFALTLTFIIKRQLFTVITYFFLIIIFEPIITYTLAGDYNVSWLYYLPFRSVDKMSYLEHIVLKVSPQPDLIVNLLMVAIYFSVSTLFNYRTLKRIDY